MIYLNLLDIKCAFFIDNFNGLLFENMNYKLTTLIIVYIFMEIIKKKQTLTTILISIEHNNILI